MMDKTIEVNVNEWIHVKMNKKGYEIMADIHNEYVGKIKGCRKRDYRYYEKRADKNGYTKFQLWCFMKDFGHHINIWGPPFFETSILIEAGKK